MINNSDIFSSSGDFYENKAGRYWWPWREKSLPARWTAESVGRQNQTAGTGGSRHDTWWQSFPPSDCNRLKLLLVVTCFYVAKIDVLQPYATVESAIKPCVWEREPWFKTESRIVRMWKPYYDPVKAMFYVISAEFSVSWFIHIPPKTHAGYRTTHFSLGHKANLFFFYVVSNSRAGMLFFFYLFWFFHFVRHISYAIYYLMLLPGLPANSSSIPHPTRFDLLLTTDLLPIRSYTNLALMFGKSVLTASFFFIVR